MLFNSLHFLFFFPLFSVLYFLFAHQYRKPLLLVASYYFYLSWKLEYGVLLFASTLVDYIVALQLDKAHTKKYRKALLAISLSINLSFLFLFKYLNFFSENLTSAINYIGISISDPVQQIILPVGISFYTFQSLSYTIDVYRKQIKAEKNFINFALFVSFFPQLVAGPIERFAYLRPQFDKVISIDPQRIAYGLKLIFWGLFQKIVIADSMAPFVNAVYSNPQQYNGITILITCVFFSFQIYCDFAGYTDMARGTAKIIGIDLSINFQRPYFSYSFVDFWRRWHISLFSWFKNYIYISLGGNKKGRWIRFRNVFIVFVASGVWHGANWTFIIWGVLTGVIYMLEMYLNRKYKISHLEVKKFYSPERFIRTLFVFTLVNATWIFFRAETIIDASIIYNQLFNHFHGPIAFGNAGITTNFFLIFLLMIAHWFDRDGSLIDHIETLPTVLRWFLYILLGILLLGLGNFGAQQFIYFQF